MGRRKLPFFEKVKITDIGAEGKALARINDRVVFTKYAAPGDIVDLQVIKKRKKYMEARIERFHNYSEIRTEPFCEHFGICGGCKWQHLPYLIQAKSKQKQVEETLKRIGKVDLPEVNPILKSENETFYRNKLEFTFSAHRWLSQEEVDSGKEFKDTRALGFHVPGLFDKVVDINKCWLQPDPSNKIRNTIREYSLKNDLEYFNQKEHGGFLRNLIIRTSSTGETMVILSFYHENKEEREKLLQHIDNEVPGIHSLMYVINSKGNDTLYDQDIKVFKGKDHIIEEMEDLKFKIGPKSFFQTNTHQAHALYRTARSYAGIKPDDIVYDLYTGTGTIANFVAKKAKKVVGIESVPEAIEDAKINAELNRITNTSFHSGDIKELLNEEFISKHGKPDVIITDPPRAGMHKNVVEQIMKVGADRIVYVSCNPATQARDLEILNQAYKVTDVQPVDMFPQTHHVENILRLKKIRSSNNSA